MPYRRIVKIDTIDTMLMECFWGKEDYISSRLLEQKVSENIIKQALDEKILDLVTRNNEQYYHITPIGKKKMN